MAIQFKPGELETSAVDGASHGAHAGRAHAALAQAGSTIGQPFQSDDSWALEELDPQFIEFLEAITLRVQAAETVDVEQLATEHPAWADRIRSLLPALQRLNAKRESVEGDSSGLGSHTGGQRTFGDFCIVREIGRGGMGIVYEAEQAALARRVALKVLPLAVAADPRALERFQLEAQVAGWLQHPRIVPVFGVGTVGEVPYYAMQFIDGCSVAAIIAELRRLIKGHADGDGDGTRGASPTTLASGLLTGHFTARRREPETVLRPALPPAPSERLEPDRLLSIQTRTYFRSVVRLCIQAAEALDYAHDRGVVHRDVKPANLLLDQQGELRVADFGMAAVGGEAGLTVTGDLPGTLRYMSPEQAAGKRALVDRRTDIYSLGATLYELLTLETLVTGTDRLAILQQIGESEPAPVRRLNPSVPVDLATIVAKATSKEASNRYETALQLADDLTRFLEGRPIAARPVGPLARTWRWCRRKPLLACLAAGLVLALAGGFVGITYSWARSGPAKAARDRLQTADGPGTRPEGGTAGPRRGRGQTSRHRSRQGQGDERFLAQQPAQAGRSREQPGL